MSGGKGPGWGCRLARWFGGGVLAATLWVAGGGASVAAEIESEPSKSDSGTQLITVVGDIEPGDVDTFRKLALKTEAAIVILQSDGGSTAAAVELGKIIRLRGYDTLVVNDGACNSACALIWLAGRERLLSKSAKIGFHATYTERGGKKQESGVGNAVVGGYLTSLGLSERAVIFATEAPPDRLNWLSHTNAAELGIPVVMMDDGEEEEVEGKGPPKFAEVGFWSIYVDATLNNGCFAYADYGATVLRLGLDAREELAGYVMVFGADWVSIKPDDEYPIELRFPSGRKFKRTFQGIDIGGAKGVSYVLEDAEIFKVIEREPEISVYYRGEVISRLALDDARAALEKMFVCQNAQTRTKDPFAR